MRRKIFLTIIIIVFLMLAAVLVTTSSLIEQKLSAFIGTQTTDESDNTEDSSSVIASLIDDTEYDEFRDDPTVYDYDMSEIQYLYVTVMEGDESRGANHTFEQVNAFVNIQGMYNFEKIYADCIVKAGDENGPVAGMFGYDSVLANATICVRGRTASGVSLKSYKLEFNDGTGYWNSMTQIALNKHYYDCTRIRNALYYKLLREMPNQLSLRTFFVHLYICDNTASGNGSGKYVDYGLYTAVEQPNKRYFKNHGLSSEGYLYKANMCEFYRYEDAIKLVTDPAYDETEFMKILEPKVGTTDHSKLIEMLEAVNNYSLSIHDVIDKYFDIDNLLDYMAFNILMQNPDSTAQNYYIYSPVNSDKWYLINWDGDGCLFYTENIIVNNKYAESSWTKGLATYSNNVLLNRIICDDVYRTMLTERIEKYHQIFTKEYINENISELRSIVKSLTLKSPDKENLRFEPDVIEQVISEMSNDTDIAYNDYCESLLKPLPFYLGDIEKAEGKLSFSWDAAYDFNAELVSYELIVSKDISFDDQYIVYRNSILGLSDTIDMLPAGTYYFRVIATNKSGYSRLPFDEVSKDGNYEGMKEFMITSDGEVVMSSANN